MANIVENISWWPLHDEVPIWAASFQVHVYYAGKLQSGKQFDACLKGKPFKFKLGKQEVIKGWDNGVAGKRAF